MSDFNVINVSATATDRGPEIFGTDATSQVVVRWSYLNCSWELYTTEKKQIEYFNEKRKSEIF